jgi:hypothetical protein
MQSITIRLDTSVLPLRGRSRFVGGPGRACMCLACANSRLIAVISVRTTELLGFTAHRTLRRTSMRFDSSPTRQPSVEHAADFPVPVLPGASPFLVGGLMT